ncbi:universal stress protein [Simkania negevensis]|uniref:Universal stress protein n=1 Tax=Simkania negevensis TaxID=83561 RepID=A0ABS3AQ56_9BACT|nr:universal stress protein [Simkania negevensis]
MAKYTHILVAIDLLPEDDEPVAEHAMDIARSTDARVSLVHVIEFKNYTIPHATLEISTEWKEESEKIAKNKLRTLGKKLGIPAQDQLLYVGNTKDMILTAADKMGVDLVVVGSHGRHGLSLLLLGSTANSVLHGAKCDVLAVNVNAANRISGAKKELATATK